MSPLTWIISYGLEFVIIAALTAIICCASFFKETELSLLFTVLVLFTMAELAFGMMVRLHVIDRQQVPVHLPARWRST